jgi:hypothetical protein
MQEAPTKKLHKCKHGCGKEGTRGPMNLHELYHCPKLKSGDRQMGTAGKTKKEPDKKCDCDDGGFWSFLSPSDSRHALLLSLGKKKYCTVCEEVI